MVQSNYKALILVTDFLLREKALSVIYFSYEHSKTNYRARRSWKSHGSTLSLIFRVYVIVQYLKCEQSLDFNVTTIAQVAWVQGDAVESALVLGSLRPE